MTYYHWNQRYLSDAEKAEQLAELRRRANENLVMNRLRRANTITHKAAM